MFKQYKIKNYRILLVVYITLLTLIGIAVIGSAKNSVQQKQIMGFVLGTILMILISLMDYSYIQRFNWLYYGGTIFLLVLVELVGHTSGGSQRWLKIGGFQFQPSELAKIMIILFFSDYFMRKQEKMNDIRELAKAFLLAGLPMGMILIQPDTSTTIVLIFVFVILVYMAGLDYKIIVTVVSVMAPVALIGIIYLLKNAETLVQKYYPVKRIMSWLDPTNPLYSDSATQQQNSIMAIASGQLFGKGLYNTSTTSLKNSNYIIEPQTDFIFAVAGEELGFVGTMAILILLILIVTECILIAKRARDLSGRLICCGMAALISFQAFVNLCVATGMMPNTGVTLPFVSYGLTSLVSLYIGMGFVLNVGLQPGKNKGGRYL